MIDEERVIRKDMSDFDLVKHLYNRRALWGTDTVWYRKTHPMSWTRVTGNYQNWEINTSGIVPPDAESRFGEPIKLFYSDDLAIWYSRRRESMPYFFRNCDADELHMVSKGRFTYETDFGVITAQERDFVLIPKGVTYRALLDEPGDSIRAIYESKPEIFPVPTEMLDHVYRKGRPALDPAKLQHPQLSKGPPPTGEFEVRVKYSGAFADFLGERSSIFYDFYPLDAEIVDGNEAAFKFSVEDIEKLGSTPVPFLGAAYLDNKNNLAWTLHIAGGGGAGRESSAPVHRDVDVDELRYSLSGPMVGSFSFTPQGVDHGAGRGYTKRERNRPQDPYDTGDTISAYTFKALKGTVDAQQVAQPSSVC